MVWANWVTNLTLHYLRLASIVGIGVLAAAVAILLLLRLRDRKFSQK